jgi:hypothetical protein
MSGMKPVVLYRACFDQHHGFAEWHYYYTLDGSEAKIAIPDGAA